MYTVHQVQGIIVSANTKIRLTLQSSGNSRFLQCAINRGRSENFVFDIGGAVSKAAIPKKKKHKAVSFFFLVFSKYHILEVRRPASAESCFAYMRNDQLRMTLSRK